MKAAVGILSGMVATCALLPGIPLAASPAAGAGIAPAGPADSRLREISYDPQAVVTVPVKRGIVTLVLLDADESIAELASGLGGDCSKPDSAWCIAAQPGGRTVFVKPKSTAAAANNLAIVTSQRVHNLRLQVLADTDPRPPVYRLMVKAPSSAPPPARALAQTRMSDGDLALALGSLLPLPPPLPSPEQLVSERLQAKPTVVNTRYSLAEGRDAQDIVPTLVFDDGRFTYLRFPGNREIPAVFQVLGDGSEALVNARVEDDLLVVDRVSRRLMLRAGAAVVGLWNEAFDIEGKPAAQGTTVPGIRRLLRSGQASLPSDGIPPMLPDLQPESRSSLDGAAP